MAEAASVSFDKARPLIGREESSAVAWQAHAHVRRCFYLLDCFFLDCFCGTRTSAGASTF